jgi:chloride channel protein, CIC family
MRERRFLLDSVILGIVGAVSALVFQLVLRGAQDLLLLGLAGYRAPGVPAEGRDLHETVGPHGLWLVPLVTALGGLVVGAVITWLAPEAEGHGTDTAVRAFHHAGGRIRARVPPLKMLASAVTIGSGGSAGREGPVALITAGVGSVYAGLRRCSEDDTRLLVLIGMAAGLAAIFRSPVGTALFAIEVLYGGMEFEAGALLYTTLSSIVAYAVSGAFLGWRPLFQVPATLGEPPVTAYGWYVVLGLGSGVMACAVPETFYRVRDLFRRLPVPAAIKPAIGGLGVGLIALALPEVLGGGYGWIQMAIDGALPVSLLLALLLVKPVALSLTISSGGSGGVFAPTLFVGAMLGGVLAAACHQPAAAFTVVGMAAVFGGAARVPIAALMMVIEMTGGYHLLVAATLAVMVSYGLQSALSRRLRYRSLYEAQVAGRADSPAHHAEHLRAALRILRERREPLPADVGRVDLVTLLQSGIPVDLPQGRRLTVAKLKDAGSLTGKPLAPSGQLGASSEVVAVLRGETMLLPGPASVLQKGDRLILLSSADDWGALEADLAPGWR